MLTVFAASNPLTGGSTNDTLPSVGWAGFLDTASLLQSLSALVLATLCALLIAFHPVTKRTVDTINEVELPKVFLMYALVGAVVGVIVLKFGMVVGFVVFGLGGLMRFKTETESTRDTGRLITVTLIGLISGLNFPHFAIITTAYAWVLIYIFDGNPVCRLDVDEVPRELTRQAADAHRAVLINCGCKVISEKASKGKVQFVLKAPRFASPEWLAAKIVSDVPVELRGDANWKVQ